MAPFRNAGPKQTLSSSSGEEEEEEEDTSSSEGEEAELEKSKISTSAPKKPSAQNQPNTSKTRPSHPQPSSSSNSEPDSPSRPDPKSKPISRAAPTRKASGAVEEMAKKKQLFGEDDEITILKGMIGFKSEREVEPGSDMNGFLEFVKESLRFSGATKTQLYEKMRRLRQKYENNMTRGEKVGKDHLVFSRAHEKIAFDLSKQIWGNIGGNGVGSGKAKVNASVRKSGSRTGSVGLLKGGKKRKVERMEVDAEVEARAGGFWSGGFCGSVGGLSLGEKIVKVGLGLISDSNKVELEGKWKKLRGEETELYSKKLGLMCEQMEAVLEVMKSQGD
ncbi:STOREKEEPER protein-like [Rhododendron vialii]|uniref:STOREKEEPER protein-like n=1 Tax=Rhododendron vialii TaxID=182163 RepID=UPI00266006F6|nr:STOREKEEPER protein-like [Rhododendron vialii]